MDLMHSKVNIVNNTVLHTSKMLNLTRSYREKEITILYYSKGFPILHYVSEFAQIHVH